MNKYVRAAICVPCGMLKMGWTKLFHFSSFSGPLISLISPHTEITMNDGAELRIGQNFKMRDGAKIRVREGAICIIGNNSSLSSNNMIVCHERVEIGDNAQFAPNVQVYDHDHDFRAVNGLSAMKYKTSPVIIGENVWIGANTVILRGTKIGDNAVIAAGSIVKGEVPSGAVLIQKRNTEIK